MSQEAWTLSSPRLKDHSCLLRCLYLSIGNIFRSPLWGRGVKIFRARKEQEGSRAIIPAYKHSVPPVDFIVLLSILVSGCTHLHPPWMPGLAVSFTGDSIHALSL